MDSFEYVPKKGAERQLLNSEGSCSICTARANEIAARANSMFKAHGYEVSPGRPGRNRAHAIVYTGDMHSVNSNRQHNTLQKALG